MMKKATATFLLLILFLTGCNEDAKESIQNGNFTLEFLFEQNGCKMYRFKDGGRYIYWSDCQGDVQRNYTTHTGKVTVTHHDQTVTSK